MEAFPRHREGKPKKSSLDDNAKRVRETAVEARERVPTAAQPSAREIHRNQVDVAFEPEESDLNGEVHLACILGQTAEV
jgi:uncharacterized protein YicC (UPF0701 family)